MLKISCLHFWGECGLIFSTPFYRLDHGGGANPTFEDKDNVKRFHFDERRHGRELMFSMQIWDNNGTPEDPKDDKLIDELTTENLLEDLAKDADSGLKIFRESNLNEAGTLTFSVGFEPKIVSDERHDVSKDGTVHVPSEDTDTLHKSVSYPL